MSAAAAALLAAANQGRPPRRCPRSASQVSHGAIQFAVYEELKVAAAALPRLHTLAPFLRPLDGSSASGGASSGGGKGSGGEGSGRQHQAARRRELSAAEITACGALSKLAASVATYPSQARAPNRQQLPPLCLLLGACVCGHLPLVSSAAVRVSGRRSQSNTGFPPPPLPGAGAAQPAAAAHGLRAQPAVHRGGGRGAQDAAGAGGWWAGRLVGGGGWSAGCEPLELQGEGGGAAWRPAATPWHRLPAVSLILVSCSPSQPFLTPPQREGLGGFYKGLVPNALRVAPQSAITFLVYESVLRLLAAGRHDGGASGGAAEVHASGGGSGARPARR